MFEANRKVTATKTLPRQPHPRSGNPTPWWLERPQRWPKLAPSQQWFQVDFSAFRRIISVWKGWTSNEVSRFVSISIRQPAQIPNVDVRRPPQGDSETMKKEWKRITVVPYLSLSVLLTGTLFWNNFLNQVFGKQNIWLFKYKFM